MGSQPIKFALGNDYFREIRQSGSYYVDKTKFISELLSEFFKVQLITRPRRFGKSLTMSMLEDFFDISRDSQPDFEGLAICEEKGLCRQWMNQWPVVSLSLKGVEGLTFGGAYGMLTALIADLCKKYEYLAGSGRVNAEDKRIFDALMGRKADEVEVKNSLYLLTRMMDAHYGKPAILLIDEYDVPLAKASEGGYYREMLDVVRAMFEKALKTNEFLQFAVVMGCLKISKESIFTGANNFVPDTVMGGRFEEYIGFTEADVRKLLDDAGFAGHGEEIRQWYDGYRFGDVNVYCPWDVLNHVAALQRDPERKPGNYWENTSHNDVIRQFISREDLWEKDHINDDFDALLAGGHIVKRVTENLTYDMLHSSADNLWSLLYMTGYLTLDAKAEGPAPGGGMAVLKIPNEEIRTLFNTTVAEWFEEKVAGMDRTELFHALWGQDAPKCAELLSQMLFEAISYHDYKEDFYHAFTVGVFSFAGYKVRSNAEEGEGRPDIVLRDERRGRAAVVEIKRTETFQEMEPECARAMEQIEERRYADGIEAEYTEVLGYGICFYKKRCMVKVKKYR